MIERYTLPEMGAIWSQQNKFQKWLDVEIAVCEVHAEDGTIPTDALERNQIESRVYGRANSTKSKKRPTTMSSLLRRIWRKISAKRRVSCITV